MAQETHLPQDGLAADEAWMRLEGWRACCVPALFRTPQIGEWVSNKQTARSKSSAGVMVAAALRHGLSTPHGGAGDRGIELCKWRVLASICTLGQRSLRKTGKSSARSASGSPHMLYCSSLAAISRWSPGSWRTVDGCAPSVASW